MVCTFDIILTFESMNGILQCDLSNETSWTDLLYGNYYY